MAYSGITPRGYTITQPLGGTSGTPNGVVSGFKAVTTLSVTLPLTPLANASILCVMIHVKAASLPTFTISCPGFTFTQRKTYTGTSMSGCVFIGIPNGATPTTNVVTITTGATATTAAVHAVEMVGTDLVDPIAKSVSNDYTLVDGQWVASNNINVASNVMLNRVGGFVNAEVPTNGVGMHFFADIGVNGCNVSAFGSGQYGNYGHSYGPAGATSGGSTSTNMSYSEVLWGDEEDARLGSSAPSRVTTGSDYCGTNVYPIEGGGLSIFFTPPAPILKSSTDLVTCTDSVKATLYSIGQDGGADNFDYTYGQVADILDDTTVGVFYGHQPWGPRWISILGTPYSGFGQGRSYYRWYYTGSGYEQISPDSSYGNLSVGLVMEIGGPDQVAEVTFASLPGQTDDGLALAAGYFATVTGGTPTQQTDPFFVGAWVKANGTVYASYQNAGYTKTDVAVSGGTPGVVVNQGDRIRASWVAATKTLTIFNVTKNASMGSAVLSGFTGGGLGYQSMAGICSVNGTTGSGAALEQFRAWPGTTVQDQYGPGVEQIVTTESASVLIVGAPMNVELWENGSFVAVLAAGIGVDSTTGQIVDVSFDASQLADPTGAGVEIRVVSPADSQVNNKLNIQAVAWDVQFLVPSLVYKNTGNGVKDTGTAVETGAVTYRTKSDTDSGSGTEAIFFFDDGRIRISGTDTATGVDTERFRIARQSHLPPDAILAATNLTGVVQYIQDDPANPDQLELDAVDPQTGVDVRVSFPTPNADLYVSGSQRIRIQIKET